MNWLLSVLIATLGPMWDPPSGSPPKSTAILEAIEQARQDAGLPALAVAAWRDGELVFLEATGVRAMGSETPVTTADRWHLGSCGKAMTATVVDRLVSEGVLAWSTTIGEVLPEIEEIDEGWRNVTVRQLVRHRSGLPDDRRPDPALMTRIRSLDGSQQERRLELVRLVLSEPPSFEPGSRMAYSNHGYTVVSALAERRTGSDWETLCRTRLFEPLGMASPGFGPPGSIGEIDQPRGHRGGIPLPPSPFADNPSVNAAAGTLHSSLEDWGRFLAVHLGRRPDLLSLARLEELHDGGDEGNYASGWVVVDRKWAEGPALTHTGSNGLWFATAWLAPARDWAFCAVTNSASPGAAEACDRAIGVMIRSFESSEAVNPAGDP
ncbi:MAG: beta-lactamase family protein [Phycisphaera sp.]|nr:beta-lactamase family protein [Phycisphaera sp.]